MTAPARMAHQRNGRGIPSADSVHALLAARIDALLASEKIVLQEAAVVGRVFWASPLRLRVPEVDIEPALLRLESRGLIVARPLSTVAGESEYAFRHALVRDVAYLGLPRSRRARAHASVAEWTERLAADRMDEFGELVAHHYWSAVASDEADLAWADMPAERSRLGPRHSTHRWRPGPSPGAATP